MYIAGGEMKASKGARGKGMQSVAEHVGTQEILVMLVVTLAALAWLVPVTVRIGVYDSLPVGSESYFSARIARQFSETGIQAWDVLQERFLPLNPYYIYLSLFITLFGTTLGYWVSTLFIVAFSLAGIWYLLRLVGVDSKVGCLALLIWILSPAYLRLSLVLEPVHMGFPLYIFALIFLFTPAERRRPRHLIAAGILLFISLFLGTFNLFLGITTLLVASFAMKEPLLGFFTLIGLPLPLMYYRQLSLTYPLFQHLFAARPYIMELVSDLGAPVGFATFALFLAAVAIFAVWKRRLPYSAGHLPVLVLGLCFLYFPRRFTLYTSPVLAMLAALGFITLWEMEWEVEMIRTLTILLIGCGLLFTGLSYFNRAVNSEPYPLQAMALAKLSGEAEGMVFSHPDNGFYIEYFAEKPAYLDGLLSNEGVQKLEHTETLYLNRNLASTTALLTQEDIRYIFISPSMKVGKVWHRDEEGLLFLLQDSLTFDNVYELPGGEVWLLKAQPEADSPTQNIIYRS